MSDHHPIHDLETFGTGGMAVSPLDPAEVRRRGERRRTRRRSAALVAAAVAAVCVIVPTALLSDGTGKDATPPVAGAPTVITYPGAGIRLTSPADVTELTGTSEEFRAFIAEQVRLATADATCVDPAQGVTVQKYSSAGYAMGGMNYCGGAAAMWAVHDDRWQEVSVSQDTWDCATLRYFGVPRSFAGDCADEDTGLVFGPNLVGNADDQFLLLRLGMSAAAIKAHGAAVDPVTGPGCRRVVYQIQQDVREDADGYLSPGEGLVALFARPGMKTPAGISLGSTLADLRAAYPQARKSQNGYWTLPVGARTEYEFAIERGDYVGEMVLTRKNQDCFG